MIRIRHGFAAGVAATIAGIGVVISAQTPATVAVRHVRTAPIHIARLVSAPVMDRIGSFSPLRSSARTVEIFGIVQNQLGTLVPHAGTVLIRELQSGRIVGTTQVNDLAQFSVRALPPGLYTAELVSSSGAVLTSSPAFSASSGQVVQLSQTIPVMPMQGFARAAASATSAALSTAASSGVLAVTPGAPVSPGR